MTDTSDAPARPTKAATRDPAFDAALGARIRAARVASRMSLTTLGEAIGVSWQQVQKYENGRDRVSVSTLATLSKVLGVHPGSFFSDDMPTSRTRPDMAPLVTKDAPRRVRHPGARIARLRDPDVVRRLMALVDALADAQDGGAPSGGEADGHAPDDGL